ncbi:MAG: choice-of-anchor L domain-containing protein, partial [Lysobacteraceae bacterium]
MPIATCRPISSSGTLVPVALVPIASPNGAASRLPGLRGRAADWLRLAALACAALVPQHAQAQATFASGSNDATLLSNLQGSGITLTNATMEAGDRVSQIGIFSNGIAGAGLQVDHGVILATGSVAESFSTNDAPTSTIDAPGPVNYSDPQLVAINANATFDAVVYSFDATLQPGFTALQTTFQFGSDEYPDYVGSVYNDVFGFFISGPGIVGWQNVALAPGSTEPIAINTINAGFLGCAQDGTPVNLTRAAQYINNGHSLTGAACTTNPGPFPVITEYNGLTRRLAVILPALQAGGTYRFKVAIADTGDASLDSAVFIDQISGITTPSITLNKITQGDAGGPFGFTLTNTVQTTGTVTTATAGTPTTVDGDTGVAGVQSFVIAAMGVPVTINENSLPAGWSLANATCVNQAAATVGSRSGSTYTITAAEVDANSSFTCTFTNSNLPILRLQKALPTGRFVATDQFALTIAGTGGPATVTTTGADTTATGIATLSPGALGAVYTLSE